METLLPSSARALKRAKAWFELLLVELQPGLDARARERVAAGVLAERERHRQAELARIDDLVRRRVLQQPVLVDAGLVGERVRAHDRLVGRYRHAGEALDESRGPADLRGVDAGVRLQEVAAHAHRHHDLLERCVAGALADAVDGALELVDAGADRGEGVRDREPEVVVAVGRERDVLELGAQLADAQDERRVLGGQHVADRVGEVDRRRAGLDGGAADRGDELRIGARGVLARELDLVHGRAGALDRRRCVRHDLVRAEAKLLLHVQRARREEDVCPRARRVEERGRGGVDVAGARAAEGGDGDVLHGARDGLDALEVAGRRGGEAGLDHVHAKPLELLPDLHLLVRAQGDSRRLLAVS